MWWIKSTKLHKMKELKYSTINLRLYLGTGPDVNVLAYSPTVGVNANFSDYTEFF